MYIYYMIFIIYLLKRYIFEIVFLICLIKIENWFLFFCRVVSKWNCFILNVIGSCFDCFLFFFIKVVVDVVVVVFC